MYKWCGYSAPKHLSWVMVTCGTRLGWGSHFMKINLRPLFTEHYVYDHMTFHFCKLQRERWINVHVQPCVRIILETDVWIPLRCTIVSLWGVQGPHSQSSKCCTFTLLLPTMYLFIYVFYIMLFVNDGLVFMVKYKRSSRPTAAVAWRHCHTQYTLNDVLLRHWLSNERNISKSE